MTHPFLAKVRAIRARNAPPPPKIAAPPELVKRSSMALTYDELDDAIAAVCAEMGDCQASRTLNAFSGLVDYTRRNDIVTLKRLPTSCAQFDAALAEAQEHGLPTGTLRPLTKVRELLAHAEAQQAQADAVPVTRVEFDAFVAAVAVVVAQIDAARDRQGFPDGNLGRRLQRVVAESAESAQRQALQRILGQAKTASENEGERERRLARRAPGQPWST